jgi:hypothetical protein
MTEEEAHKRFDEAHEQYRLAAREMDSLNRLKDVPTLSPQRRHLMAGSLGISS